MQAELDAALSAASWPQPLLGRAAEEREGGIGGIGGQHHGKAAAICACVEALTEIQLLATPAGDSPAKLWAVDRLLEPLRKRLVKHNSKLLQTHQPGPFAPHPCIPWNYA